MLAERAEESRITDLAVLTRDRPDSLERCLTRFAHDDEARRVRFIVFDDAFDEPSATANANAIDRARRSTSREILHITRRHRARWVRALIDAGHGVLDPEIVRRGVLGEPGSDIITGANRNAVLLSLLGRRVLSVDDDLVPPAAPMLEAQPGVRFAPYGDPTEFHFFGDRRAAREALDAGEESVFDLHSGLLGQFVQHCLAEHDQPIPHSLTDSGHARRSRVTLTVCGLAGDAGMSSSFYYALLPNPSRARWVQNWSTSRTTREIIRGVTRTTISGANLLMAANVGYDLNQWVPPFVPIGRNQDGPVALVLRLVAPEQFIGHLPHVLFHDPPNARQSSVEQAAAAVQFAQSSHQLMMCISASPRNTFQRDPAARTARLGRFLVECTEEPGLFRRMLRTEALRSQEVRIGRLEDALASRDGEPEGWVNHVRLLLRVANQTMSDPNYPLPSDIAGTDAQRHEAVRARIRSFGKLLEQWPSLREVASEVQRCGRGLLD